jgi:hypothetical protein
MLQINIESEAEESAGMTKKRKAALVGLMCCGFAALASAQDASNVANACVASPTTLQLLNDPLLVRTIHRRTALHGADTVAPDGASKLSQDWLAGTRKWYIENQRDGGDLMEAGVVLHDKHLVDVALKEFEWGYARQSKKDGGWLETGDAFHSVSIFLLDSTRAMLAVEEAGPEFKEFFPRIDALKPAARLAGEWLIAPANLKPGKERDSPFTHRRWILAAALGMAGQFTGDAALTASAAQFAEEGFALQKPDGLNPERDGFDVSYEVVDALQGDRYYTTLTCAHDAALMPKVRLMIQRTLGWEERRMLPSGAIDVTGSTRVLKETGRDGEIKHINYKEIVQAYTYGSAILRDPHDHAVAEKLAQSQGWDPQHPKPADAAAKP